MKTVEPILSPPLLYSFASAALMWGVSIHTVRKDARRGRILTLPYGRRRLIPRSEILRISEQGMEKIA
jgi:hypothetical protein